MHAVLAIGLGLLVVELAWLVGGCLRDGFASLGDSRRARAVARAYVRAYWLTVGVGVLLTLGRRWMR